MRILQWIQSLLFWFLLGPFEISAASNNGEAWAESGRRVPRTAPEIRNHPRKTQQGNTKNKQGTATNAPTTPPQVTNPRTTPAPSSFHQSPPPPSSSSSSNPAPPSVAPVQGGAPSNTGTTPTNGSSNSNNHSTTGSGTDNHPTAPTDHNTTTSANPALEQVCRAVDLGTPLTTNNTVKVTYTFELHTTNAATTATTATATPPPSAADAVNTAVADYLIQQYITPYCHHPKIHRYYRRATTMRRPRTFRNLPSTPLFAAGDVRGVSQATSTLVQPCSTTTITDCVSQWQTSNTISFAPDYDIVAHHADAQIVSDIAAAFAAGNITARVVVQQQQQPPNGGGGANNNNTNTNTNTFNVTGTTYVSGSTKVSSATTSAPGGGSSHQGMSPAGKFFLTLFLLLLVAAAVGYAVHKYGWYGQIRESCWKRRHASVAVPRTSFRSRADKSRPLSDDEATTPRPRAGDSAVETKETYFQDDRNLFTSTTASTDDFGTEMILDDLKKDEDLFPTNASDFCRYSPTGLPRPQERDRPVPSHDHNDSSGAGNYNFSMTADVINLSDIDILVDDGSLDASLSPLYLQAAKRAYSVPDTVNL